MSSCVGVGFRGGRAGREASQALVRDFGTFTRDLEAIAEWLSSCGVRQVAMESTGVYWIPLFEVLERAGFEVHLVKTLPEDSQRRVEGDYPEIAKILERGREMFGKWRYFEPDVAEHAILAIVDRFIRFPIAGAVRTSPGAA